MTARLAENIALIVVTAIANRLASSSHKASFAGMPVGHKGLLRHPFLRECALVDKRSWAFQQIADRLEGKPVQPVAHSGTDDRDIEEFTDAELTAILRSKLVPVETEEERPESESLN